MTATPSPPPAPVPVPTCLHGHSYRKAPTQRLTQRPKLIMTSAFGYPTQQRQQQAPGHVSVSPRGCPLDCHTMPHTSKRASRSHANKEVKHKKSARATNSQRQSNPNQTKTNPTTHPHIHYQQQQQQQQLELDQAAAETEIR